jgi:argininosuccinate lyase
MKLWSGRFRGRLHPEALNFSSSLDVDKLLFREDIAGSIAHVAMLAKQKILNAREARTIQRSLRLIEREIASGRLRWNGKGKPSKRFVVEDIHMAIEQRLIEKLGDLGGKIHTARSRNDQIALDERLYLKREIRTILNAIRQLQRALVGKAEQYRSVAMPGYTHLQRAQPILLAHHLLAYTSMLDRDAERFGDCLKRVDRSPLGAGALAGTSFPIDRKHVSRILGFAGIVENSIDAVSDRDVHIEFLSACAIAMMHLSRLAEELVIWSSEEWDFVELSDAYTTGSSIMPQKKNPDMAELVRGKTGRVYGNLITLLTVMKGLPLAYNRDMQEDKEPLFDSVGTLAQSLRICAGMVTSARFNTKRFEAMGITDFILATELADYLVRNGIPFRKAHSIVGSIVRNCIDRGIMLDNLSIADFRRFSPSFKRGVLKLLNVRSSLQAKCSAGSTSPSEVRKAIRSWKRRLRRS